MAPCITSLASMKDILNNIGYFYENYFFQWQIRMKF
jgi:hypothetical protein